MATNTFSNVFGTSGTGGSTPSSTIHVMTLSIGNGIDDLSTGALTTYPRSPVTGTITKVSLYSDATGSIVVDIWKDTHANFPPTVADTIIPSGTKPTLSSARSNQITSFTGWTTAVTAGDVFAFSIDSVATAKQVTMLVEITT